jgi:hypothetical protein
MRLRLTGWIAAPVLALLASGTAAGAQEVTTGPKAKAFTPAEVEAVPMPALAFTVTPQIAGDFDKYYYFHREGVSFDEAFADISECDRLSNGLAAYTGASEPYPGYYASQYGVGGVIGGVLGEMFADMIHGSAARRAMRRVNMRNCMGYKGYHRYGLAKDLWEVFNFEEGNGRKDEDIRTAKLMQQAKVASGPKPQTEVLAR